MSSASRSHSGCVSHQGILSFHDNGASHSQDTIWPSKFKVKGTPVSAVSSSLISLVFHIRASYQLPSLSFHGNRASRSQDTILPWKFKVKVKVKGTLVSVADSFPFCFTSFRPSNPKIWQIECSTREKRIWNFMKKLSKKTNLTEFLQNLIRWEAWLGEYTYQVL